MSGRKIAKRSILGTRISVPINGYPMPGITLYVPAVISSTRQLGQQTSYSVVFTTNDDDLNSVLPPRKEYSADQLIGPGFQPVTSIKKLSPGQRVFITLKGREVSGTILNHSDDSVVLNVDKDQMHKILKEESSLLESSLSANNTLQVKTRLEDIRLLESRKSARLQDSEKDVLDFSKFLSQSLGSTHSFKEEKYSSSLPGTSLLMKETNDLRNHVANDGQRIRTNSMSSDNSIVSTATTINDSMDGRYLTSAAVTQGRKRRPSDEEEEDNNSRGSPSSSHHNVHHHHRLYLHPLLHQQNPNSISPNSSSVIPEMNSSEDLIMDDCAAAMVLMSLSCSPKSPITFFKGSIPAGTSLLAANQINNNDNNTSNNIVAKDLDAGKHSSSWLSNGSGDSGVQSPSSSSTEGGTSSTSTRKTCSPPFEFSATTNNAYDCLPVKERQVIPLIRKTILYQCTWPGCDMKYRQNSAVERHVRTVHLGPGDFEENEEEFYYTEIELEAHDARNCPQGDNESVGSDGSVTSGMSPVSSPGPFTVIGAEAPTWSHLDMARPPTEDPEYIQEQLRQRQRKGIQHMLHLSSPINIPSNHQPNNNFFHRNKVMRIESGSSIHSQAKSLLASPASASPASSSKARGRSRGETRKCRKVYGMESRDSWCTQCKWKKACTRFTD